MDEQFTSVDEFSNQLELTGVQYDNMREAIERSTFIDLGYDTVKYLKTIGIDFLTGEACGLSMRVLCDLTQDGQALLSTFFGGVEFTARGWNNYNGKSVMLTRSIFQDIVIYSMCNKYPVVIHCKNKDNKNYVDTNHVRGFLSLEDWKLAKPHYDNIHRGNYRLYMSSGTAMSGMRNEHVMSGRVT